MTRFDRRKLLTSGAAAAVLLGAGVAAHARPKRGGLLRAALSGGVAGEDWLTPGAHVRPFMMSAAQGAVFETLTEVAPDGTLRGELLRSWNGTEAGLEWVLTLRDNARFHDGTPVRASDVIDALGHHRENTVGTAAQLMQSAHARDRAVHVRLTRPEPQFPYLLSDPRLFVFARRGSGGIAGSGLYRPERFEPGVVLEARRVPDHPLLDRAGWFDEISIRAENDATSQETLLRARKVDVADLAQIEGDGFTHHRVEPGPWARGFDGLATMGGYGVTTHMRVAVPRVLGGLWPVDNGRIAERWWMA